MNSNLVKHDLLADEEHFRISFAKWIRSISIIYFIEAVTLFLLSFLLFFIRRTAGIDPHMVSGAFSGTTQLTYFVVINIMAVLFALMGYYIYKYMHDDFVDDIANIYLLNYFKLAGIISIVLFGSILWGIYYFAL